MTCIRTNESEADCTDVDPLPETCPRCHTTEPWGESSWCPVCSYYPVVDGLDTETSWAESLPEVVEEEADEGSPLESIPGWFWVLLAGVVGITLMSVAVRLMFPEDDSPRGMVALAQLTVGLVSMLVAHIIVSKYALSHDRWLNLNDVVLSWFSVWQPAFDRLPQTSRLVLAMAWGAWAALTAVTIIGGIDYSAPFRVHTKAVEIKTDAVVGAVTAAAKAGANKQVASMEEALTELAGTEEQLMDVRDELSSMSGEEGGDEEGDRNDVVYTLDCFVYGVEIDSQKVPRAFLFAGDTRGHNQHVARIATEDLPRDDFRRIAVELSSAVQKTAAIETDRTAVWVRPEVWCRIAFQGLTEDGQLRDPMFEARVIRQQGLSAPGRPQIQKRRVSLPSQSN